MNYKVSREILLLNSNFTSIIRTELDYPEKNTLKEQLKPFLHIKEHYRHYVELVESISKF